MTEQKPELSEILFEILEIIFVVVAVVLIINVFVSFRPVVEARFLERLSTEMAATLASSPLTVHNAVFLEEKLLEAEGDAEPYARHCLVGYKARIVSREKEFSFGYEPSSRTVIEDIAPVERSYPVALHVPGEKATAAPATLTLTLYETWMTRLTCLAESALSENRIKEMRISCIESPVPERTAEPDVPFPDARDCLLDIEHTGTHLCMKNAIGRAVECRRSPAPVESFSKRYKGGLLLKAVPATEGGGCENPQLPERATRVVICAEELA